MSSETARHELLSALAELGRLFPDWRMGQTLANLAMAAGHPESDAVWNLEDDEALAAVRRLIDRNTSRQASDPDKTLQQTAAE
jgi:hypothetical protein